MQTHLSCAIILEGQGHSDPLGTLDVFAALPSAPNEECLVDASQPQQVPNVHLLSPNSEDDDQLCDATSSPSATVRLCLIYEAPSPLALPPHQTLALTPAYMTGKSGRWQSGGSAIRDKSSLRLLARFPIRPWMELAFDRRVTAREAKPHVSFRLRQPNDPAAPFSCAKLNTDVVSMILDELFDGDHDTFTSRSLAVALPKWASLIQSLHSRHVQHLPPWAPWRLVTKTVRGDESSNEAQRVLAAIEGCQALEQVVSVWSTPPFARHLLDALERNSNMKHAHLCKAPSNISAESSTSFCFSFADLARVFAAWPHLETMEIDSAFEPSKPGQSLAAHQVTTLQTISLNNGAAIVSELRHLIQLSLHSLTTLCLAEVSGLDGQALCSLVMECSALKHLSLSSIDPIDQASLGWASTHPRTSRSLSEAYPYQAALGLQLEGLPLEYVKLGGSFNSPLVLLHIPTTLRMLELEESDFTAGADFLSAVIGMTSTPRQPCRLSLCTLIGDWQDQEEIHRFVEEATSRNFAATVEQV